MSQLSELSQSVLVLSRSVDKLCEAAKTYGFRSPQNESWYELLNLKLVRQLSKRPYLVVAVTGGTNTGKSVVFNHLASETASATDHRAAGTKHPVCLVPANQTIETTYDEETPEELLKRHFDSFDIVPWTGPSDPLKEDSKHHLFWRIGENVPDRLLLVDTPDIDSDAEVNWERARAVRQTSDLIIAVLTEQKYADAAVKQFFREATEAAKPVILIFNMVDVENDLQEVPLWVAQFERETGVKPTQVLVSPYDRDAASKLQLEFFTLNPENKLQPCNLDTVLTELHFETIKTQTLQGALRMICDKDGGVARYLDSVRQESRQWGDARKTLENADGIKIDWPGLPTAILVEEIRDWWDKRRPEWSRKIHNTYRKVGNTIAWPAKKLWNSFAKKEEIDPLTEFQKQETKTVTTIVEKTIEQLERLSQTENPVLRNFIQELLTGENRRRLLDQAKTAHKSLVPIDDDFRSFLHETLTKWSEDNPAAVNVVRSLDLAAAITRPAVTITLAATGFVFVGSLVTHVVLETAITGGITGTGEVLVNQTGEGIKRNVAKLFQSVQEEYAKNRARHFFTWFQREIWGHLISQLQRGEQIIDSPLFNETETAAGYVQKLYESLG